jgi:hypothetical protein
MLYKIYGVIPPCFQTVKKKERLFIRTGLELVLYSSIYKDYASFLGWPRQLLM